jgi:hypothetical protein
VSKTVAIFIVTFGPWRNISFCLTFRSDSGHFGREFEIVICTPERVDMALHSHNFFIGILLNTHSNYNFLNQNLLTLLNCMLDGLIYFTLCTGFL